MAAPPELPPDELVELLDDELAELEVDELLDDDDDDEVLLLLLELPEAPSATLKATRLSASQIESISQVEAVAGTVVRTVSCPFEPR